MQILGELYPEYASEEHLAIHLTAGGAAGALASAVTTPLDVIKTRLQCQVLFYQFYPREGSHMCTMQQKPLCILGRTFQTKPQILQKS